MEQAIVEQLRLDLEPPVAGDAEEFTSGGKPYLAYIAPRYGIRLRVMPKRHNATGRETGNAYYAFGAAHESRIERLCRQRWF